MDDAGFLRQAQHRLAFGGVHRQRLLADDVLAGRDRLPRQWRVQMVRRGDVDGVTRFAGKCVAQCWVERDSQRLRAFPAGVGARTDDGRDLDAVAPQGIKVDQANEAWPDDNRAQPLSHLDSRANASASPSLSATPIFAWTPSLANQYQCQQWYCFPMIDCTYRASVHLDVVPPAFSAPAMALRSRRLARSGQQRRAAARASREAGMALRDEQHHQSPRDVPPVGRPRGAVWRSLQADGVVWEGQVLLVGDDVDLAARMIVTHRRVVFVRGGDVVLDVPRAWLRQEPVMRRGGVLDIFVSAPGSNVFDEPMTVSIRMREGHPAAGHIIAMLAPGGARRISPDALSGMERAREAAPAPRFGGFWDDDAEHDAAMEPLVAASAGAAAPERR